MSPIKICVDNTSLKLVRLRYVLDFLETHPLAPVGVKIVHCSEPESADIVYAKRPILGSVFIPKKGFFFHPANTPLSVDKSDSEQLISQWLGFEQITGEKEFNFDVFEFIFFHISRWEEWAVPSDKLDLHGRMPSEDMVLVKNNRHNTAVVDRLVADFYRMLGYNQALPPTRYRMTHDVDILEKFPSYNKVLRAAANLVFKIKQPAKLPQLIRQYTSATSGKDPFDTFDWLLKRSDSFDKKIIYFLSGGRTNFEGYFDIESHKARKVIKEAIARGYEIGIHPSYLSADNKGLTNIEKTKLEEITLNPISKTRQHFLRWKFPDTPRIIETCNLSEDSTLGFSDRIGFRCGTGFPFRLYDFEREQAYDFWEVPLVVMDVALLRLVSSHQNAFDLGSQEITNVGKLLESFLKANADGTMITFNFHNSTFDSLFLDTEGLKSIYLAIGG